MKNLRIYQKNKNENYLYKKIKQSYSYIRERNGQKSRNIKEAITSRGTYWYVPDIKELDDFAMLRNKYSDSFPDYTEVVDFNKVPTLISEYAKQYLRIVSKKFPDIHIPKLNVKTMDSKRPWKNMVTVGEDDNFILIINENATFTKSDIISYALHEVIGHMVHFEQLKQNTELQDIYPALLGISIHTQDAFLVEGIAQLMYYLVSHDNQLSDRERFTFYNFSLGFAVKHYAITKIIEGKLTYEEAFKIHKKYLPDDKSASTGMYRLIANDPFFSGQILNYHSAFVLFKKFYQTTKPSIKHILNTFWTYEDLL